MTKIKTLETPVTCKVILDGKEVTHTITETKIYDDGSSPSISTILGELYEQKFKDDNCEYEFVIIEKRERTYGPPTWKIISRMNCDAKEAYKKVNPNNENCHFTLKFVGKEYESVEFFNNNYKGTKHRSMVKKIIEDF